VRLALNHSLAPHLSIPEFLDFAAAAGVDAVELRNGMPPGWHLPPAADVTTYAPARIARLAADAGISVLTINALLDFNRWNAERAEQARALIATAAAAGIDAIVLCPTVAAPGEAVPHSNLPSALDALIPLLTDAGIRGLVEPLGFPQASVRRAHDVDVCLRERGSPLCLGVVHDTFHHALAGAAGYSPFIGLIHVSGVTRSDVPVAALGDEDRVLVTEVDTLASCAQIAAIGAGGGFAGNAPAVSLEPFARSVAESPTLAADVRASLAVLASLTTGTEPA